MPEVIFSMSIELLAFSFPFELYLKKNMSLEALSIFPTIIISNSYYSGSKG